MKPRTYDRTRDQCIASLERPEAIARFAEAVKRQPVLGTYPTPLEAIDALLGLKVARAHDYGRGADAALREILSEYQSSTSDVWATMLVVAFYPAINRLWRRIKSDHHESEELRDIVIAAFLAGARALPRIDDVTKIPVRLKTEMERRAFDEVKGACADRALTHELVTEALDRGRIEPFVNGRVEAVPHAADEVAELDEMAVALLAGAPGAVATLNDKEPSLRRLTHALRPDLSPAEQERLYQRIKRWYLRRRADGVESSSLPPWWRVLMDRKEDERRRPR